MLRDVIVAAGEEVHLVFLQQWLKERGGRRKGVCERGSVGIWVSGLVCKRVCYVM